MEIKKGKVFLIICIFFLIFIITVIEGILQSNNCNFLDPEKTLVINADYKKYHMFSDKNFIPDPYLLWTPNPKRSNYFNSKGFRCPEFSAIKPESKIRIFCFGDSNTLGDKVTCWPDELQILLNTEKNFEIINAGVIGYSSFQGLRKLKQCIQYYPDIAIFCFCWNDAYPYTTISDRDYAGKIKKYFSLRKFLYRFKLYQFFKAGASRIFQKKFYKRPHGYKTLKMRVPVKEFKANVIDFIQTARSNNITILLMTRPYNSSLTEADYKNWVEKIAAVYEFPDFFRKKLMLDIKNWDTTIGTYNKIISNMSKEYSIPLLDAREIFKERPGYFKDACHFNEAGHRFMAKKLYEFLTVVFPEFFD